MSDFWLTNSSWFITPLVLLFGFFWLSLNFYTGENKKLHLMVNDINELGYVRKTVREFDRMSNRNGLDPLGFSFISHLIYRIPKELVNPKLYQNGDFLEQLDLVKLYRSIYKIVWSFILIDGAFIALMVFLYGGPG